MKKLYIFVFVISIITITVSCQFPRVEGNGELIEKDIKLKGFKGVVLKGAGKVFISQTDSFNILVKTDSNILEHLTFKIKKNLLYLGRTDMNLRPTKLEYYISLPYLKKISLLGSGNISTNDYFLSKSLDLNISGSGNIKVMTNTSYMQASISGSGDMNIIGSAEESDISITGSGSIKGGEFVSGKSKIKITGSGDIVLKSTKSIDAQITGSGSVKYKGNPEHVNKKITGSGSVKQIN